MVLRQLYRVLVPDDSLLRFSEQKNKAFFISDKYLICSWRVPPKLKIAIEKPNDRKNCAFICGILDISGAFVTKIVTLLLPI